MLFLFQYSFVGVDAERTPLKSTRVKIKSAQICTTNPTRSPSLVPRVWSALACFGSMAENRSSFCKVTAGENPFFPFSSYIQHLLLMAAGFIYLFIG